MHDAAVLESPEVTVADNTEEIIVEKLTAFDEALKVYYSPCSPREGFRDT